MTLETQLFVILFFTQIIAVTDNPKGIVSIPAPTKKLNFLDISLLRPLSWEINNSFAEKVLSLYKIHHVLSCITCVHDIPHANHKNLFPSLKQVLQA